MVVYPTSLDYMMVLMVGGLLYISSRLLLLYCSFYTAAVHEELEGKSLYMPF